MHRSQEKTPNSRAERGRLLHEYIGYMYITICIILITRICSNRKLFHFQFYLRSHIDAFSLKQKLFKISNFLINAGAFSRSLSPYLTAEIGHPPAATNQRECSGSRSRWGSAVHAGWRLPINAWLRSMLREFGENWPGAGFYPMPPGFAAGMSAGLRNRRRALDWIRT